MILLHWADAWHNSEHSARLSTAPGEFSKYVFTPGLQPLFDNPVVVGVVVAFDVVGARRRRAGDTGSRRRPAGLVVETVSSRKLEPYLSVKLPFKAVSNAALSEAVSKVKATFVVGNVAAVVAAVVAALVVTCDVEVAAGAAVVAGEAGVAEVAASIVVVAVVVVCVAVLVKAIVVCVIFVVTPQ